MKIIIRKNIDNFIHVTEQIRTCTFHQALFQVFEVRRIVDIYQSIHVILALILVQ